MEKEEVLTLVRRDDHIHVADEFILGNIVGIGYMISNARGYNIMEICEGYLYIKEFTRDEYDKFKNVIEELYPGLCKFNYKERESY